MEQANSKGFYQYAMQYGTYLGIFWAVMYILLFKYPNNATLSMIALGILIGSPFIAGRYAAFYRKRECNDSIKYPQAWTFLFCMYICATLFSAMTNYIFFSIIDQGAFLMDLNETLLQMINAPGIDEESRMQFEGLQDMVSHLTANETVWQLLNNNIFNSLILPPVIALFVRKNNDTI